MKLVLIEVQLMSLKPQTERNKAHRIFKFYKATSKFPPDVSTLESYSLLAKYNYFIAKDVDTKTISILTRMCNVLDRERVIIMYGDFMIETLTFGLESFKYTEKRNVKTIYVDSIDQIPEEALRNVATSSSHRNDFIIYIIDNIDVLNKKSFDYLEKLKEKLQSVNKAIILVTMLIDKIDTKYSNKFIKIRLGKTYQSKSMLKSTVLHFLCNDDRDKVKELLIESNIELGYFLKLITHNLPVFYKNNAKNMLHNVSVIEEAHKKLYKVGNDLLINYLANAFIVSNIKRTIRFPKKIPKKSIIKNSNESNISKTTKKSIKKTHNKKQLIVQKRIKKGLLKYS